MSEFLVRSLWMNTENNTDQVTNEEDVGTMEEVAEDNSKCKCGQVIKRNKIVGGVETEVNEYPWQVGLVNRGGSIVWCGGSVISSSWILTAAHCITGEFPFSIQVIMAPSQYWC